jgi:TetR/AcrR family transcriptional regulator, mexCD-oprJ operon repressor
MSQTEPRMSLRARVSEAIVEAAATVLADLGPQASMSDVAETAGVARATLYRYFPTREALLDAVAAFACDRSAEGLSAARLSHVSVREGVSRAVRVLVGVGDHFVVLAREGANDADFERRIATPLLELMERGQRENEIRADVPASWLTQTLLGMVVTALSSGGRLGTEDTVHTVTSLFLEGALDQPG